MYNSYLVFRDAETTEVSWMKVDDNNIATPVKKDNLKYTIQDNTRRLLIDKPTYVEDNGKFRCVPYYRLNPFQNNARDIELIVACKPFINANILLFFFWFTHTLSHYYLEIFQDIFDKWYIVLKEKDTFVCDRAMRKLLHLICLVFIMALLI